jgi:hypothetical protein
MDKLGVLVKSFAFGELLGELSEALLMIYKRSPLVVGGGRAGVANADAPVVARGDENEREQSAWQRLGFVSETFMNTATAFGAEKNATAIRPGIQVVASVPGRSGAFENWQAAQLFVAFPVLSLNPPAFLVRDHDDVFLAATAANVAVPILNDGKMA